MHTFDTVFGVTIGKPTDTNKGTFYNNIEDAQYNAIDIIEKNTNHKNEYVYITEYVYFEGKCIRQDDSYVTCTLI